MIRKCPICLTNPVPRKDIKTCGGTDCVATWRTLTAAQKGRAIERASESIDIVSLDDFKPTPMPSGDAPLKSSTERDNEALRKIFGEDAPGIVVPIKKKDDDSRSG